MNQKNKIELSDFTIWTVLQVSKNIRKLNFRSLQCIWIAELRYATNGLHLDNFASG